MKQFFNIYIPSDSWPHFQMIGHSHGSFCRWKYTPTIPRVEKLWNLCLDVAEYHNLDHHDIMLEAVKSIQGLPCQNHIKNPPSEK